MARLSLYDPWRDFSSLQDRINRVFSSYTPQDDEAFEVGELSPVVDIYEDDKTFVFEADLPGFNKEDIKIDISNNILTISGNRKLEREENKDKYLRVERSYGTFARRFTLPNTIDSEKVEAKYKNGVLTLKLPKKEEALPKSIDVKVEWIFLSPVSYGGAFFMVFVTGCHKILTTPNFFKDIELFFCFSYFCQF